jgi:hypothetical protein
MKTIISLLLLSLLCSCSKRYVEENTLADTVMTVSEEELSNTGYDEANGVLQRDSLLSIWHDNLIHITKTNLSYRSEKKPEANRFVGGQIDTIERLTFKESNVVIYHTPDKTILISSDIRNPEISLSEEIKIGTPRKNVLKHLHTESTRDTLTVLDFEGNTNVMLILKDNLLTRIVYSGYVD